MPCGVIAQVKPGLVVDRSDVHVFRSLRSSFPSPWGSKPRFPNMRSISTTRCFVWPSSGPPAGSLTCPVVSMTPYTQTHAEQHHSGQVLLYSAKECDPFDINSRPYWNLLAYIKGRNQIFGNLFHLKENFLVYSTFSQTQTKI